MPGCPCDNFLYGFKGTPCGRARPSGLGRIRTRKRGGSRNCVKQRMDHAGAGRDRGQLADSGAGGLPRPCRAGALRARRRHQVSRPASAGRQFPPQRTPIHRDRENRPGRPPRAGHPLAAQRSQSRSYVLAAQCRVVKAIGWVSSSRSTAPPRCSVSDLSATWGHFATAHYPNVALDIGAKSLTTRHWI